MVRLVEQLLQRGMAYVQGSVYFSIARFPAYGDFAHVDSRAIQNEVAQSEEPRARPCPGTWMHTEFINIEGVKLYKSLGNQLLLRDLAGLVDGAGRGEVVCGFRYFVVTNHCRTALNFTKASLGVRSRCASPGGASSNI